MKAPSKHSPADIAATVKALSDLLWQYDDLDRTLFAPLFGRVLKDPDDTAILIRAMKLVVGFQAPVTKDKALDAAIRGRAK